MLQGAGMVMLVGTALGNAGAQAGATYSNEAAGEHAGLSSPAYIAHPACRVRSQALLPCQVLGGVATLWCALRRCVLPFVFLLALMGPFVSCSSCQFRKQGRKESESARERVRERVSVCVL